MRNQALYRRLVGAACLLGALAIASPSSSQPKAEYSKEGATACLDCHETKRVMGIVDTVHADFDDPRTPAAQKQCQSCHGPSSVHMRFPMQVDNIHFGKASTTGAEGQNARCLVCHEDGTAGHWKASAHGFEHLVCSTCHNLHSPSKIVPSRAKVTEGCMTSGCHADMMAKADPSEFIHPIGSATAGKDSFVCSDCHDPHGPLNSGRCGDCHAQTPALLAQQSEKAQRFHAVASARDTDCMRCHRGIAHPLPDDVLEAARREQERHAK